MNNENEEFETTKNTPAENQVEAQGKEKKTESFSAKYYCPFCQEPIDEEKINYICSHHGVEGIKKDKDNVPRCSKCEEARTVDVVKVNAIECGKCKKYFSTKLLDKEYEVYRISLVGTTSSGKTCFKSRLNEEIVHWFREGEFDLPAQTKTNDIVSLEENQPLPQSNETMGSNSYLFDRPDFIGFEDDDSGRKIILIIYDFSGEDIYHGLQRNANLKTNTDIGNKVRRIINRSDAVFFIMDPEQSFSRNMGNQNFKAQEEAKINADIDLLLRYVPTVNEDELVKCFDINEKDIKDLIQAVKDEDGKHESLRELLKEHAFYMLIKIFNDIEFLRNNHFDNNDLNTELGGEIADSLRNALNQKDNTALSEFCRNYDFASLKQKTTKQQIGEEQKNMTQIIRVLISHIRKTKEDNKDFKPPKIAYIFSKLDSGNNMKVFKRINDSYKHNNIDLLWNGDTLNYTNYKRDPIKDYSTIIYDVMDDQNETHFLNLFNCPSFCKENTDIAFFVTSALGIGSIVRRQEVYDRERGKKVFKNYLIRKTDAVGVLDPLCWLIYREKPQLKVIMSNRQNIWRKILNKLMSFFA